MQLFATSVRALNAAGVTWVFALTFLICADVIARTVFDSPIAGVTEIVSLSLVATVFMMVAHAIQQRRLMRVEMVLGPLAVHRPVLAADVQSLFCIVGAALSALIAIGMWPDFLRALRTAEFAGVEGIYKIHVWPIKLLVFLGAAVAALELLRQAFFARPEASESASGASGRWLAAAGIALLALLCAALVWTDAEPRTIGVAMIGVVIALIVLGMPIAFALLFVGFVGVALLKRDATIATLTLALAAEGTVSEYVFAAVPLFVLMGLFVTVSEIGRDAFKIAQRVFGRIHGGLGVATVAANAVFAAITGISIAAAAIFTKIAVPEMVRQGYTKRFARRHSRADRGEADRAPGSRHDIRDHLLPGGGVRHVGH